MTITDQARERAAREYGNINNPGLRETLREAYATGYDARGADDQAAPSEQSLATAERHVLDQNTPVLNLGYYRYSATCRCGYEVIWGHHDEDATREEAMRTHVMRSNVFAFRALDAARGADAPEPTLDERLWDAITQVRDQHPRVFNDAPTDEIVAAILPHVQQAQNDALATAADQWAADPEHWLRDGAPNPEEAA